jgi:hypothetical protein
MVMIILINMTDCLFYSKNGPIYKYVMEVRTWELLFCFAADSRSNISNK